MEGRYVRACVKGKEGGREGERDGGTVEGERRGRK